MNVDEILKLKKKCYVKTVQTISIFVQHFQRIHFKRTKPFCVCVSKNV